MSRLIEKVTEAICYSRSKWSGSKGVTVSSEVCDALCSDCLEGAKAALAVVLQKVHADLERDYWPTYWLLHYADKNGIQIETGHETSDG